MRLEQAKFQASPIHPPHSYSAVTSGPARTVDAPPNVDALFAFYGCKPAGQFLQFARGTTHYIFEPPYNAVAGASDSSASTAASPRRIAVCAHGIGTSTSVYETIATRLRRCGYHVLRYDFLGHGWSVGETVWMRYDADLFIEQLQTLLDHVLLDHERVDCFVGHSTGAVVGVVACMQLARQIDNLVLISPVLWKNAPLTVQIADRCPQLVWRGLQGVLKPLRLGAQAYLENTDAAFAKDAAGRYLYPEAHATARAFNTRLLRSHPHIDGAIAGITFFFFNQDNLPRWRAAFASLGERSTQPRRAALLWGTRDVVVAYDKHAAEAVAMGRPGRFSLLALRDLGHDSLVENPEAVADAVQRCLKPSHTALAEAPGQAARSSGGADAGASSGERREAPRSRL